MHEKDKNFYIKVNGQTNDERKKSLRNIRVLRNVHIFTSNFLGITGVSLAAYNPTNEKALPVTIAISATLLALFALGLNVVIEENIKIQHIKQLIKYSEMGKIAKKSV